MLCIGYALSYLSMMQYKLERDRIGESVAWGAFTQSASGVA